MSVVTSETVKFIKQAAKNMWQVDKMIWGRVSNYFLKRQRDDCNNHFDASTYNQVFRKKCTCIIGFSYFLKSVRHLVCIDTPPYSELHIGMRSEIKEFMGLLPDTQNCGCACAGNAGNVFPVTAGKRSRHASRHVRHARAVMHAGIAN